MSKTPAAGGFAEAVAANVRARAAARQVSQRDLADALDLSINAVNRRYRGLFPWALDEIAAIAPMLGCEPSDLTRVGA